MLIFKKIHDLKVHLAKIAKEHKTLGFVPTMGALHQGHLSLIAISKDQCDFTICSIFVNPTQFNDASDLERYPRMPEVDSKLLESGGCDILFLPSVEEIYPTENKPVFDFGQLDKVLEGQHRPGHFNGVAQVVKRFFEIIQPTKAFFGSKDYQQVMIVKALVKQMNSLIEIIACPILRDPDGLAMSSRNALLSKEERIIASLIPKIMQEAKQLVLTKGILEAKLFIDTQVIQAPGMKMDYFEVCNSDTLQIIDHFNSQIKSVSLIAVFVGKIRLIDNLILN